MFSGGCIANRKFVVFFGCVADVSRRGYEYPVCAVETVLGPLDAAAGVARGELYSDRAAGFISGVKVGLKMLDEHATHAAGGNGVEAGITEMLERMQTGRFKVFRGQEQWLEEFRYYRREDGLIVKERDDLISSTRYAIMMRRYAKQSPSVERWKPKPKHSGWAA